MFARAFFSFFFCSRINYFCIVPGCQKPRFCFFRKRPGHRVNAPGRLWGFYACKIMARKIFFSLFCPSDSFSWPFFSLSLFRNSDPGSHSRRFSSPTHYGPCLAFFSREDLSSFFPRRLALDVSCIIRKKSIVLLKSIIYTGTPEYQVFITRNS